jgi:hypothetical protein
MLSLTTPETNAIRAGTVSTRDLVWITARNRSNGDPVGIGFWSDAGNVSFNVIDALTGSTVGRSFNGGSLLSVGEIENVSDLSVITVQLEFSAFDAAVELAMRTHDVRLAPVQIYQLLLDPLTSIPVAAARARFVGIIDEAPVTDGKEGEGGVVRMVAASQSRELSRVNSSVRSHDSQLARAAGDAFYKDTATVGEWDIAWGQQTRPGSAAKT